MRAAAAAVGLVLLATPTHGANQTPSDRSAFLFQPYEWNLGDTGDEYFWAMYNQGYSLTEAREPFQETGIPQSANLPVLWSNLNGAGDDPDTTGYGCWFQISHGSLLGFGAEAYPYTEDGEQLSWSQYEWYRDHGYGWRVYPGVSHGNGYHVGIDPFAIRERFQSSDCLVYNATCNNQQWADTAWTGSRVRLGYEITPDYYDADAEAFWNRMDGADGLVGRACTDAKLFCQLSLAGEGSTTLSPAISAVNLEEHQQIPSDGVDVAITFDTECATNYPADWVLFMSGSTIRFEDATWIGNTGLCARLVGVEGESGASTFGVSSFYLCSAQNEWAHLDGDLYQEGSEDWTIDLKHDSNPAANILSVRWVNGSVEWIVACEYRTAGYRVEGRHGPDGGWEHIGDPQPPGAGVRRCQVGTAYSEYRVVEIEANGHEKPGQAVSTATPALARYPETSAESLRREFEQMLREGPADGGNALLAGEKIIIFTPGAWTSLFDEVADYLNDWYGISTDITAIEQYGAPENRFPGIKGRIAALYSSGYRYVLLAGDASDWQYFDGPYTAEYWPTSEWESVRQDYFTRGFPHGGNPSMNIIPAVMVKAPLPPTQNVAFYRPYYEKSDMLSYGDINDDGYPDLAVGRWPITSADECLAMATKLLGYFAQGGEGYDTPYTISVFLGDADANEAGDGVLAVQTATAIKTKFRPGTLFRDLLESDYANVSTRVAAAVEHWHRQSDVVLMVASGSTHYAPGHFFNLPIFDMSMIAPGTFTPFVLGMSCATANEYMTEDPALNAGVERRMLTAVGKGAVAWIGPSCGTTQQGNRVVAERIVEYIEDDPSRPVGDSVRGALRDVIQFSSPDDPDHLMAAMSYQFLGFPLVPLNHRQVTIGVEAEDGHVVGPRLSLQCANPMVESGSVRWSQPRRGSVRLVVCDVAGRQIAGLASGDHDAGWHAVAWDPENRVSAGAYFLKLQTMDGEVTRQIQVVK